MTAAHAIPLNDVNAPVTITTGRRLREEGWPEGADFDIDLAEGDEALLHGSRRFEREPPDWASLLKETR